MSIKTNKKICFHHIPKCAGSAFKKDVLGVHYQLVEDYRDRKDRGPLDANGFGQKYDLSKLKNNQILCGHFEGKLINDNNCSIFKRYPLLADQSQALVFTMLRHPLEMCISMFFFSRRRRNIDLEKQKPEKVYDDLEKFIMNKKNYTKFIFDIETESQIPEKLTQYAFIGVTEKFEESCQLLAGMINISTSFNQSFFNKTKRTSAVRDIINKNYGNLMSAHQEFNDDYSIYNYALNKLKNC